MSEQRDIKQEREEEYDRLLRLAVTSVHLVSREDRQRLITRGLWILRPIWKDGRCRFVPEIDPGVKRYLELRSRGG